MFVKLVAAGGVAASLGSVTLAQQESDIELLGNANGWEGVAPDDIADETNPTLQLVEGEDYVVVWENDDGAPHDFFIENEAGEVVVESERVDEEGERVSVEFTAQADFAEYYCSVHPESMVGDVEVGEDEDEEEMEDEEEDEEEEDEMDDFPREYEADLTGDPHDVDTDASGRATFEVHDHEEELDAHYELTVENICNVTQAHIHLGGEEEDGPVVVWLYPEEGMEPELIDGLASGTIAEGTITEDDLVGEWEGADFEDVVETFEAGGSYVNVHTEEHPGGEIRGQIEPADGS